MNNKDKLPKKDRIIYIILIAICLFRITELFYERVGECKILKVKEEIEKKFLDFNERDKDRICELIRREKIELKILDYCTGRASSIL